MCTRCLALHPPDPQVRIRPVRATDIPPLIAGCWSDRPPAEVHQLVNRAQQNARQGRGLGAVIVAENADSPIGYGQLTIWPRTAEISDLVVTENQRGRGLGTAMIQYLVRAAREMHAPAVEIGAAYSNPGALALYRRLGFQDSHVISLHLGNGMEDVLYLKIDLLE